MGCRRPLAHSAEMKRVGHSAAKGCAKRDALLRVLPQCRNRFSHLWMLDLGSFDIEETASALGDQTDFEHRWLVDPRSGQVAFWTRDTGIDGQNPVDIEAGSVPPIQEPGL